MSAKAVKQIAISKRALVEPTPTIVEQVCTSLRAGLGVKVAASTAGLSIDRVRRWLSQGDKDEEAGEETQYSRFCAAYREAWSEGVTEIIEIIANSKDWRAHQWRVDRLYPELIVSEEEKGLDADAVAQRLRAALGMDGEPPKEKG